MDISAVVLAKNEEKNIAESAQMLSFCSEIIVVDNNSMDKTAQIASSLGCRVIPSATENDFSKLRNLGLKFAKNDWVLFIDADERISKELALEMTTSIKTEKYKGFYIKRRDVIWGKKISYGEIGNVKLLRLAKKSVGKWQGKVHETWNIKGEKGLLENELLHYPHPTVSEFLAEINAYSSIRAQELYEKNVKPNWFLIVLCPLAKFKLNYFFRLGFLDGVQGLLIAVIMSMHSFLARAKLWLLWQKK